MKAGILILLATVGSASAEGVFSGAPNPGLLRHSAAGLKGHLALAGSAAALAALVLLLIPRRDHRVGVGPVAAQTRAVIPALLLPSLGLLALGETLVWIRQGDFAAYASVFFATVTGTVLLQTGFGGLNRWRNALLGELTPVEVERLESGLLALAEIGVGAMLVFLLAFLPPDSAALGLLMFALGQALVVYANTGVGGEFGERLLLGAVRGNAVLIALILLLQTAFEPTSIEALVLVEFCLAVRLLAPAMLLVATRFLQPVVAEGLLADEAVELGGWVRIVAAVTTVCGVGFVVLDGFSAEGFFIHRDLWWCLPLPVYLGMAARLVPVRHHPALGVPLLTGLLAANGCFELEALDYLVSGTHGAMDWGLSLVLLAWGWSLGDQCRLAGAQPMMPARPEAEALALAGVAVIMSQDWFDLAANRLSLLDHKVVVGLLLGLLLSRACFGMDGSEARAGATWRLSGLAFVFPVLGLVVGLPLISIFVFLSALLVFAAAQTTAVCNGAAAVRARLHLVVLAGFPGLAIAVGVLQRLGNADHALLARIVMAAGIGASGCLLAWCCQRADCRACQASK